LKIYSKLLTPWLRFYYRNCLTRQIFSVIYYFSFTYRSHTYSTSFILLRLFVQIILCILSHYSTPGTSYKLFPLLIFYSKKRLENLLRGEGEREKRRERKEEEGTEKDFSQTTEDRWPPSSLGPCLLPCTFGHLANALLSPPDNDVH